ncbi:MarR family winged helix-turn-helix transcriptional regulator [Aurantimonas sp. Leaf443]|uniref:MarR family winged helix-turn-helix transcriptional regulator n=1 Tax=Aurantimonas sp. Leaf443 TaxID=1736378 RepID=UPI0006FDF4B7|nr:MarR family winged helix-turn-helix transcriptional regulator [Aurantimonas sp. Leaf443]KQT85452.1 hypothetical protein ASG48_09470 [Aurantimonas sp. Leaf443]
MPQLVPGNALGFLLTDTSRLYRQIFDRMVEEDGLEVTSGELRALAYVARFSGSRQAVLAERMGVEPMTLSAYLDRLEARGLIRRSVDARDRRAKVIEPTQAAEAVFMRVRPMITKCYARITNGFTDDERQLVETLLQRMRANLSQDPSDIGETPGLEMPMSVATPEPAR